MSSKRNRQKNDTVILVMGMTGAGKSSFINNAVGRTVTAVGHGLESCTKNVSAAMVPYPRDKSRTILLIDTPGLDGTYLDDSDVLKLIADWLARSPRMKIAGIIYMHDISERLVGTSQQSVLRKLCENGVAKNITLTTTKWSRCSDGGQSREKELSETSWKQMLDLGSRVARFGDTRESAWEIVNCIIDFPREPIDPTVFRSLVDTKPMAPRGFLKLFKKLF